MADQGLLRVTSYAEQAHEAIKHLIFEGTYGPGERLKEVELSRALGTSRSPIREALKSLANEGLVKLAPQKGAFVSSFDLAEIRELYEVRGALEELAARQAAERAKPQELGELLRFLRATEEALATNSSSLYPYDLDFHQQVCKLSRNATLMGYVSEIHAQLQLARSRSSSRPGRARQAYEEHLTVYQALKERDPKRAEEAMKSHLRKGLMSTLEILSDREEGKPR